MRYVERGSFNHSRPPERSYCKALQHQAEVAPLAGLDAQSARRVVHALYPTADGPHSAALVGGTALADYVVGRVFHVFRHHYLGQGPFAPKASAAGTYLWCDYCCRWHHCANFSVAAPLVAADLRANYRSSSV